MKKKQVWRYECEYCGKKNYAAWAMNRHEPSCTKNPHRFCKVCAILEEIQTPTHKLIDCLPPLEDVQSEIDIPMGWGENYTMETQRIFNEESTKIVNESLPLLRKKANDCPACIMAALRQKGIPVPVATDFDYKKEMESIFSEINEDRLSEGGGCY